MASRIVRIVKWSVEAVYWGLAFTLLTTMILALVWAWIHNS